MGQIDFNFGNALSHFKKTDGPAGFLLRFVGVFLIAQLLLQGAGLYFNLPIYEVYVEMFTNDLPPDELAERMNEASSKSGIASLLITPISMLVWMVFEGASQRRYMRGDGFKLKLGNDEWRLLVVGLLWLAILFAFYIVIAIFVGAPLLIGAIAQSSSAMQGAAIISGVLALIGLAGAVYLIARLSPAAALTIRDESIRFFEAWKLTKGRVGTLVGANLVLWIASFLGMLLFYAGVIAIVVWRFAPAFDGDAEIGALASQPGFWVPITLLCVLWLAFMAVMQHVMGGPAALAAKDDPSWVGNENIAHEFG